MGPMSGQGGNRQCARLAMSRTIVGADSFMDDEQCRALVDMAKLVVRRERVEQTNPESAPRRRAMACAVWGTRGRGW